MKRPTIRQLQGLAANLLEDSVEDREEAERYQTKGDTEAAALREGSASALAHAARRIKALIDGE